MPRRFLTGSELSSGELAGLLDRALELKAEPLASHALAGRRLTYVGDGNNVARSLYGARQRIWDQAENRRHAQKALLEWLVE